MISLIAIGSFCAATLPFFYYKAHLNTRKCQMNLVNLVESSDVHSQTKTLNILHISDMHLENLSITPTVIYEILRDKAIDLIALTGDFLDRKSSIPKLAPYLETFNRLNPKHGIYAVFGNHDYVLRKRNFPMLQQTLADYGCIALQNSHRSIDVDGSRLNIVGIDDFSTKRSDVSAAFRGVGDGYNLVLTHDPNVVLHMDDVDYHYLLSGHFHGGQIHWPKPYHLVKMGKLARKNVIKGLHFHRGKPFYISEGLGQTGVNIRVRSRPELTLHTVAIR